MKAILIPPALRILNNILLQPLILHAGSRLVHLDNNNQANHQENNPPLPLLFNSNITLWGFSQLWWKQTHQTWRAEWIDKLNQVSSLTYTCFHNIIGKSQAASFCNTFASAGIRNLEQGYGWALSIICSYLFTFLLKNNKGTLSEVACLYNEKSSSISEKLDVLQNKIFTVAF